MNALKKFWFLVGPFWRTNPIRYRALFLLVVVVGLNLSTVWFNVKLSNWNNAFYTALQHLEASTIYTLLLEFVGIVSAFVLVLVYTDWLEKKLNIDWRREMTREALEKWINGDALSYRLQMAGMEPDNPDQRIAEDIEKLITSSMDLFVSFLRSILTLVSFVTILWTLGGNLSLPLGEGGVTIVGYMFWLCLMYSLVATGITHWIGKPLVTLNFEQQRREANFRSALVEERHQAESVAAQGGWACERQRLRAHFELIAQNWRQLMDKNRNLSFFTVSFNQVSNLTPIVFALPQFLAGALQLGGLIQLRIAFRQVQTSLGWVIYSYRALADWQATVNRLYGFYDVLSRPLPRAPLERGGEDLEVAITLKDPQNQVLIKDVNFTVKPGAWVLLKGASGLGKSTLLRAIAGYWPYFEGRIKKPHVTEFWLPQRVWIQPMSLRELLAYPRSPDTVTHEQMVEALTEVGLARLVDDLDEVTPWHHRLSGGEAQRVLLARLSLLAPQLVLLDESTSALDRQSLHKVERWLKAKLGSSMVVLVSHQQSWESLVDEVVHLPSPQA